MTGALTAGERIGARVSLALIVALGFALRLYNLDFPSVGYHNMKENEYLSMAQEMQRTQDYVTRRIYFYNGFEETPTVRYYPQPPLVSYQTVLAWRLFGENLWAPRLVNVFFGTASIVLTYLLVQLLFANVALSLWAALVMAYLPLAVFFSRNLQPESPAFFFMLLGNVCYLRFWLRKKTGDLFWGGIAFAAAWAYKFSFLVGMLPFFLVVPWADILRRAGAFRRKALWAAASFLPVVGMVLWLVAVKQWQFDPDETLNRIKLFSVFSPSYWLKNGKMIWWYIQGENFTPVFTALAAAGMACAAATSRSIPGRFILGWGVSLVLYAMVFPDHINQHNYYQMPFLILICCASSYSLLQISHYLARLIKKETLLVLLIVAALVSLPFAQASLVRMFGSVFMGLDVAGESLRGLTAPHERIFLNAYPQGQGIARYARRYVGWPKTFEEFKAMEQKYGIRYLCFYPAEFAQRLQLQHPEWFSYVRNNYHVKEVGLTEEPRKLYFIILERGAADPSQNFLTSFSGSLQLRTIYRVFSNFLFFYTLRPPPLPAAGAPAAAQAQ